MRTFNNVATASSGWDADGLPLFTFGSLEQLGVLSKSYRAANASMDPDMGFDILWAVLEPCYINGTEYAVGDVIEWTK